MITSKRRENSSISSGVRAPGTLTNPRGLKMRDLAENETLWRPPSNGRSQSVSILLAQPELDFTMRPRSVLPLMEAIMGSELCADEHSVMVRAANRDGPTECVWHRDACGGGTGPPYYTRYLSVVFYLTDVDETTHTFSVIPGSAQTSEAKDLEEYDLATAHHIEHPGQTHRTSSLPPVVSMRISTRPSWHMRNSGPNRFATLNEARQLCPHLGIDPHLVLGQDADVLTQPIGLDRDIALQRLGDLVQHRAPPWRDRGVAA